MAVMSGEPIKDQFTSFYEKESDALFRFCYWRVTNRELALELAQESFARLWAKMAEGAQMDNQRAFLYVVARHLIIDWYRKGKSGSLEALSEEGERPFEPMDQNAHIDIEVGSEARRVAEKINDLPEQYRDVVYMRFVEDLRPREISQILKISTNAVSVRITRGLEELRRISGIDKK
jgi:RNA polymerase sigma-70 factor, ECF subfamily